MAATIKVKRSGVAGNPTTLAQGELAYSWLEDNGANGGDRLYVGTGTETTGDAANHQVIGGKFFVDMLDHTKGVLTPNSALIADSDSKLNQIIIDNVTIDGNTISTSSGDLILSATGNVDVNNKKITSLAGPSVASDAATKGYVDGIVGGDSITLTTAGNSGTGSVALANSDLTVTGDTGITVTASTTFLTVDLDDTSVVPGTYGSASTVPKLTVDQQGRITFIDDSAVNAASSLTINNDTISLQDSELFIYAGEGIDVGTDSANNIITISGEDATTANKGIASFNSADFGVSSGDVTIKSGGVSNTQLVNSSVTVTAGDGLINGGEVSLGSSITLDVNVDDVSIETNADALRIKAGGVTNAMMAFDSVTITAGDGLGGGGTVAFGGSVSLNVNVDDNSIETNADTLRVKALGITNAMLAGSIENSKLSNSAIGITAGNGLTGGGTTALGDSATLDVNVDNSSIEINADILRVKALGITNGMLAGSIANAKLANDTITIGSTGIALGGTSTTLAGLTNVTVDNINIDANTISTTTGALYLDPAAAGDSGEVYIYGDLIVEGTTTTINSTEVTFDDTNIVLADSATTPGEANGAGITVNGANATIIYASAGDEWQFNKDVDITGNLSVSGTILFGADSVGEVVDDRVASLLLAGEAIDLTYNDGLNKLTVAAELATITNPGVIAFDSDQFQFYGAGSNTATIYQLDGGTY